MVLLPVWKAAFLLLSCPLIGGLPLVGWITRAISRKQLAELGTGNLSVSAAFYHGGTLAGVLAVLSEAAKGILAVILARLLFPGQPVWELVALMALVVGRFTIARGAGVTNVVWGYVVHDWRVAALTTLLGGIGFTILRERQRGRLAVLVLFPALTILLHPHDQLRGGAAIALATLIGWIYSRIPDDLSLSADTARTGSQRMFRFFQGERAIASLDQPLSARRVGQKAATLSQLRRWGYPVPQGWVLPAGDDPAPLLAFLDPSEQYPLVVRSSAIGEDSEQASAAGQYETTLHVSNPVALEAAIACCLASYDQPNAIQYRQDRGLPEDAMAVLVQEQVRGVFSGVAFSRDPIARQGDAVVIEALPGEATQVVSGQVTPETYRVMLSGQTLPTGAERWVMPEELNLDLEGSGDVPPRLIQQVAFLARHLEQRFHGIPQDVEWSYDGQTLWLLQSRPITTLLPIWTRKIAAEVIPGLIRPLTWSVNRPLTCGVWGDLFTLVLSDRVRDLDFNQTATLHHSRAYFNASLLGQIFRRMGLPAESLEFLTRGAKFSKPPLASTLKNVPGLLRLVGRELRLEQDFQRDCRQHFTPLLTQLAQASPDTLTPIALLTRIDEILAALKRATYYSILAPLSAALRQAIFKVPDNALDNGRTPEVAALRSLRDIAVLARAGLGSELSGLKAGDVSMTLAARLEGKPALDALDQWLQTYGYLSEVGTDIAVPTWREQPQPLHDLFAQFVLELPPNPPALQTANGKIRQVQRRLDLKGQVTEVYSRLLAELRWSFVALEQQWLAKQRLQEPGDIFFLEFDEIRQLVTEDKPTLKSQVPDLIAQRRSQRQQDAEMDSVPPLVYGNTPPGQLAPKLGATSSRQLQGIGASPGQVEGRVKVLRSLQAADDITQETILVVPYTDSGWAPLLARAGGLISEVGGRLSHGAIVAREYGIPAVMDIHNATRQLQDGQRVRIDGQQGIVELL